VISGWDVVAGAFVVMVVLHVRSKDAAATRALARREDDSRVAADLVLLGSSLASLVGVALVLRLAANAQGAGHGLLTAVAVLSVVMSWSAVHTVYTLRYARLYYAVDGGIDFHGDGPPDYGDFAYMALTLGMTFQVSDTDLTARPIRRAAMVHALISYLFGSVVVGMTINVIAGLLAK
jgi:uncharacterized membrane protein